MEYLLDLTPAQKKAFNDLKKAYKACERKGVLLVNRYGSLYAYNSNKITAYGVEDWVDDPKVAVIDVSESENFFKIASEWADDDGLHFYGLTEKGLKIYNEE